MNIDMHESVPPLSLSLSLIPVVAAYDAVDSAPLADMTNAWNTTHLPVKAS